MKKIFTAVAATALLATAVSCNKNSASVSAEDKAFGDTVSVTFGQFLGQNIKMQEEQIQAQLGDKFNEAEYLRGVKAALKLDTANISYLLGVQLGQQVMVQLYQWSQQGLQTDPELIASTIVKSMNDSTIDAQQSYFAFQMMNQRIEQRMKEKEREANAAVAIENGDKAAKYVEEQKAADPEIKTTESGLSYKITEAGEEAKPDSKAAVKVIYTGRHIDGTEFDSSNGNPVEFRLDGVVKGFSEGLQLLGKGGKATLYIPGELAYGPDGQPRAGIGPNEMLVFDVELVEFTPSEEPAE